MQSKAATVDEYLKEVPPERFPALTRLRDLCRTLLVGYEETIQYGMPSYAKDGVVEVAFNSQKNYISLYIMKQDVVDAFRDRLPDAGKGCIRFSKPEKIDFDLVEKLLRGTVASSGNVC